MRKLSVRRGGGGGAGGGGEGAVFWLFSHADNVELLKKYSSCLNVTKHPSIYLLCPQRNVGRHIVVAMSVRQSVHPASCAVHISYIL